MPIKISNNLPTKEILNSENIFVMEENRASHQDVRPIRIVILNLMPAKIVTETQLLRLLGNSPLQVEVTMVHPKTFASNDNFEEHLLASYYYFEDIKDKKFDGAIITGAPSELEEMEFEKVNYWEEFKNILEWTRTNVTSTLHICWSAEASLYYNYGVHKHQLLDKVSGVFISKVNNSNEKLLRGFDDEFYVPQSKISEVKRKDIEKISNLKIISESDEIGMYIIISKDGRQVFVLGHFEYDQYTLKLEYERDIECGFKVTAPKNYSMKIKVNKKPSVKWRSHANLLVTNWLNYYVYQETPYEL